MLLVVGSGGVPGVVHDGRKGGRDSTSVTQRGWQILHVDRSFTLTFSLIAWGFDRPAVPLSYRLRPGLGLFGLSRE